MGKSSQQLGEKILCIDESPSDAALALSHLPGLIYLDSSSAESIGAPPGNGNHRSIIAASPTNFFSGNIHNETSRALLQNVLSTRENDGPDLGFPKGGLIGWIEYNGDFFFGEYPEMLVFDYSSQQWFEIGNLSHHFHPARIQKQAAPQMPLSVRDGSDREQFCAMVERAQDYIASGDIYQVNLAHRFEGQWKGDQDDALQLYLRLRQVSPAPFSGFMSLGGKTILSASPEQFLRISGRTIQTRPIKGTRPRFRDRELDEKSAYDLITSPKEIAELIMITDLERNDLGQICDFGSVEATELLKLERFAQVFHLVSTIEGNLREEIGPVEALAACFPGGSITGAPKKRAREIIAELESTPRSVYTGAMGCLGYNGESIFNILIRTAVMENELFHFHAGAGIVADSDPELEWEETLHKAAGIQRAISGV